LQTLPQRGIRRPLDIARAIRLHGAADDEETPSSNGAWHDRALFPRTVRIFWPSRGYRPDP
jgi:hypothetical protein